MTPSSLLDGSDSGTGYGYGSGYGYGTPNQVTNTTTTLPRDQLIPTVTKLLRLAWKSAGNSDKLTPTPEPTDEELLIRACLGGDEYAKPQSRIPDPPTFHISDSLQAHTAYGRRLFLDIGWRFQYATSLPSGEQVGLTLDPVDDRCKLNLNELHRALHAHCEETKEFENK